MLSPKNFADKLSKVTDSENNNESGKAEYLTKLKTANNKIKNADYLLTTTFKAFKEPKILINVLKNIDESFDMIISALCYRDRDLKLIPKFHDSSSSRLDVFKQRLALKYGFDKNLIKLITEVRELIEQHKTSSVEFTRKTEFIICNNAFGIKKINYENTKQYLEVAKKFVFEIEKIIQTDKIK